MQNDYKLRLNNHRGTKTDTKESQNDTKQKDTQNYHKEMQNHHTHKDIQCPECNCK